MTHASLSNAGSHSEREAEWEERRCVGTLGGCYLLRTEMSLCSHVTFFQKTLDQKHDVASNYYLVKELNEKSICLDNK